MNIHNVRATLLLALASLAAPSIAQKSMVEDFPALVKFDADWKASATVNPNLDADLQSKIALQVSLTKVKVSPNNGKTLYDAYSIDCLTYPLVDYRMEIVLAKRFDPNAAPAYPGEGDRAKYVSYDEVGYWVPTRFTDDDLVEAYGPLPPDKARVEEVRQTSPRGSAIPVEKAKDHLGTYIRILWRPEGAPSTEPWHRAELFLTFASAKPAK